MAQDPPPKTPSSNEFELHRESLRSFLRGKLRQESDVEDCLQTVSLKWIKHGQLFHGPRLRAWLFTVAGNEAALIWRRAARSDRLKESIAGKSVDTEGTYDPVDDEETKAVVRCAIAKLPDELRSIVELRMETNLTFEQISKQLQIPLGTALSRMHRALARLESELDSLQ